MAPLRPRHSFRSPISSTASASRRCGAKLPPSAAPGINLLQAGNVRVDFTQHSGDSPGVIAPVDPDAGMNVVGHDSNREAVLRPDGLRSNAGAAVESRPPASLGVQ